MEYTRQGRRARRPIAALVAVLAVVAGSVLIASPAAAEDDPTMAYVRCTSEDYPDVDFPDSYLMACVELRLTSGEATFGSLSTTIDQLIQVRQALLLETVVTENGPEIVITPLPEAGGGAPSLPTIEVPGGLLAGTGLEALAPLTEPVTGVSATLMTAGPLSASDFNFQALFTGTGVLAKTNLPIGVQVNNLLLGTSCTVGNVEDPINLGMDLGLNGQIGITPDPEGAGINTALFDLTLADPAFAIPGASGCGLVGPVLDDLGLSSVNVFNTAVDGAAGTPSPEEANHVTFQGVLGLSIGE